MNLVDGFKPSEKYDFVNWENYSQYKGKIKNVPNHQPDKIANHKTSGLTQRTGKLPFFDGKSHNFNGHFAIFHRYVELLEGKSSAKSVPKV